MHLANPEGTPGTKPKRASRSPFFDNGAGVSNWRLQRWFYPDGNKPPLTYHPDRKRWRRDAHHAYLQSVGRGQEFVLDLAHYPEAIEWLSDLVSSLGSVTRS